MNTHKFKAGDEVVIRGVVLNNDGQDILPYLVRINGNLKAFNESDLSFVFDAAPQTATEINRTEIFTRLVEAWIKKNGYAPSYDYMLELYNTVNSIIQLSKTHSND